MRFRNFVASDDQEIVRERCSTYESSWCGIVRASTAPSLDIAGTWFSAVKTGAKKYIRTGSTGWESIKRVILYLHVKMCTCSAFCFPSLKLFSYRFQSQKWPSQTLLLLVNMCARSAFRSWFIVDFYIVSKHRNELHKTWRGLYKRHDAWYSPPKCSYFSQICCLYNIDSITLARIVLTAREICKTQSENSWRPIMASSV